MIIMTSVLLVFLLIYFSYPFWLLLSSKEKTGSEVVNEKISSISLIYLSNNGDKYIEKKIDLLIKDLAIYNSYEIIIIDDQSNDGTKEILKKYDKHPYINIIYKNKQVGIPNSMNLGCQLAKYDHIVFCDQRQDIPIGCVSSLIQELEYSNVGAVSSRISHRNENENLSIIRKWENYNKSLEGKTGNVMGVYGPLYAIKKKYYQEIPANIILDDLYLTIKILKNAEVKISDKCVIIDEDMCVLYDYKRAKRYLKGLIQLTKERRLIGQLKPKQILMLAWHKYLRLMLPLLLLAEYIAIGIASLQNSIIMYVFILITLMGLFSLISKSFQINWGILTVFRINLYYIVAHFDIVCNDYCTKTVKDKFSAKKPR